MEQNLFNSLKDILNNADINDVTAEGSGFSELPDGYYLCELNKVEFKSTKETGLPMACLTYKIINNGIDVKMNDNGTIDYVELAKTSGRLIWSNYVIKDEASLKRFVTDMLKFEDENDEPLLEKDIFKDPDLMEQALQLLVDRRIYIQATTTETQDGKINHWKNPVTWKRIKKLELPE